MVLGILADIVLILHLVFIVFVLLGGFLALYWKPILWIHLPSVLWVAALEFGGWVCPLTPLENWLRQKGGESGFSGGFIEHYLVSLIYPIGLTPTIQMLLGLIVVFLNLGIYGYVYRRKSE